MKMPEFLKKGDKVMFLSTARKVTDAEIRPAKERVEQWGLQVMLGQHLFSEHHQFAGTDEQRLDDFQRALDDPSIKAIFFARGGYGSPRIVDAIDWSRFSKDPKWLVGFSDVTVLLNKAALAGVCALHAPMLLFYDKPEYTDSIENLKSFLFGVKQQYQLGSHTFNKAGIGTGELVGGNLSLLINSIGTTSHFDPSAKILFIEDIDEYLYHIDRMMVHLERAGVLKAINGLIVGHFSDMKDNNIPFGETAYEIIARHTANYHYPVAFAFPVGHAFPNYSIPVGKLSRLEVGNEVTRLDFL